MTRSRFTPAAALAAAAACALAPPAAAQTVRAPTPAPAQQPGLRAPDVSPASQGLGALTLRLDALEQAVGRQLVVLEQDQAAPGESWPAASDNFPNNNTRAEAACRDALGDRFGRVVSRQRRTEGNLYYLSRVVCEAR